MVELALLLPVLVFGLIGAADLARAFALQLAIQNGARAGAEAYAINFTPTQALAISRAIDEMARTPGINTSDPSLNVNADIAQADGVTACIRPPTVATPCFVTVSVQYTFRTIVPWPFIPNTANFDRSTTMRTFY
ncbi:MAG: TadE/TadG family type IV pilus assembly protein [Candidatus Limnocylindria bacterium]